MTVLVLDGPIGPFPGTAASQPLRIAAPDLAAGAPHGGGGLFYSEIGGETGSLPELKWGRLRADEQGAAFGRPVSERWFAFQQQTNGTARRQVGRSPIPKGHIRHVNSVCPADTFVEHAAEPPAAQPQRRGSPSLSVKPLGRP